MKLAIMQPYVLPYLGYFQLIAAVDKFVFLDDVQFIMRGWVNRNRLLKDGSDWLFSVPLVGASQNRLINEIEIVAQSEWRRKLMGTIQNLYRKAPHYEAAIVWLEHLLDRQHRTIGELAKSSVREALAYAGLSRMLVDTSADYDNQTLKGADRIVDICRQEHATMYINPPGGRELYAPADFREINCKLRFIAPHLAAYHQGKHDFVPGLSILDVMMFNSPEQMQQLILMGEVVE